MHDHAPIDGSFPFNSAATFIVIADGSRAKRIARLAQEHAEFDPESRRVLAPDDALYPPLRSIAPWRSRDVAALVLSPSGTVCALLDRQQAVSAAWIEDAFLSAGRP